MGFSRQEYWSGLPCLPSGDLPNSGIEPTSLMSSLLAGVFFTTSTTCEALRLTYMYTYMWTSLVAQAVKNSPALWETWVGSLGWEDPLEEGMATHSSILAWRIPMDKRSLVGYSPRGYKESDMTEQLSPAQG